MNINKLLLFNTKMFGQNVNNKKYAIVLNTCQHIIVHIYTE